MAVGYSGWVRRADRLFQIVQHLRGRRLTTAARLAEWLQVSERTIYRDIRDLSLSGVPVEGEAGVGYRLGPGFELPPLMFTLDEVEALVTGARIVEAWAGPDLAKHARAAVAKIEQVLPRGRKQEVAGTRLFALNFHVPKQSFEGMETLRRAILERRKVRIAYLDAQQRATERIVWPLALYFWGTAWSLAAWCETRKDFRNFRLDRVRKLELLSERFEETPGRRLEDYLRRAVD